MFAAGRPTAGRALPRPHAWSVLLCLSLIAGLLFLPAINANAASFVVTNIDDGGQGSLRQAILDANANPGADAITFAIPGSGAQTISPASPLPAITEQVSLDATTQPGSPRATPGRRRCSSGSRGPAPGRPPPA